MSVKRNAVLLVVFGMLTAGLIELQRRNVSFGFLPSVVEKGAEIHGWPVLLLLAVVFGIVAANQLIMLLIGAQVTLRRGAPGEVRMLGGLVRFAAALAIGLAILVSVGRIGVLGAGFALFGGMLLGWSLQAPVSGMAAWALINIKRPFRVGDRIMLPSLGMNGDVIDIGLMYTSLNQVGGTIGSEEAIGRHILIPNAMLFTQVVINYTPEMGADEQAHFLDEVIVRITFNSDWEAAEQILLNAARDVTGRIIAETGQQPYIRSDFYDYGVYMRLRYMTLATDRPRITHELTRRIFRDFQRDLRVDLAIPYVYSYRHTLSAERFRYPDKDEQVQEIAVVEIDDAWVPGSLPPHEEEAIADLAHHIEAVGLLQPLVLEPLPNGRYRVLAGVNRLRACKHLGWTRVPATMRPPGAPPAR
ncbi:MAG TPA: ParB N-terminal domain-containing protein [Armatimonadota bacterium]|nr:ParB N-terminal domain-containing protein [Armatimonadota bacterium]